MAIEAFGIEFETNVKVTGAVSYQLTVYQANDMKWKIALDGVEGGNAVLEFVTEPLISSDETLQTFTEINAFIELVTARFDGQTKTMGEIGTSLALVDEKWTNRAVGVGALNIEIRKDNFVGAPQVTVGVPLAGLNDYLRSAGKLPTPYYFSMVSAEINQAYEEKCREALRQKNVLMAADKWNAQKQRKLLDYMAEWKKEKLKDIQEAIRTNALYIDPKVRFPMADIVNSVEAANTWKQQKKEAGDGSITDTDYDKACGLMTLVLLYLNCGYAVTNRVPYAKAAFTVLSRTCFSAMYNVLGTAAPLFTVDEVMTYWGASDSQRTSPVIRNGFKEKDITINGTKYDVVDETADGPNRADWIQSILTPNNGELVNGNAGLVYERNSHDTQASVRDCDRASEAANPDITFNFATKDLMSSGACAYNSTSMGLQSATKSVEGQPFVVIEFRQWPPDMVPKDQWFTFAQYLFNAYKIALT